MILTSPLDDTDTCYSLETTVLNPNQYWGPHIFFKFCNYLGVFIMGDLETSNVTGQIFYCQNVSYGYIGINSSNKYFLNAHNLGIDKK